MLHIRVPVRSLKKICVYMYISMTLEGTVQNLLKLTVIYKSYSAKLEFQDGICTQNLKILLKRIARAGDSCPEKFLVFWKFLLLWNETPRICKIPRFSCIMLHNFLVSVIISYFLLEVIFFLFYQELNAVRSENSKLCRWISRILPGFWRNNSAFMQNDHGFKKY